MPGFKFICKSHLGVRPQPRSSPDWVDTAHPTAQRPCAKVYNTHCGILAPGTRASPVSPQTRGDWGSSRGPCLKVHFKKVLAVHSVLFPKDPLKEAQAPLTLAAEAAPPPPHLLRTLPDEQMRNARPAAAALRVPPPDHRTESDIGVARLQLHQASEDGGMGQGQARLELERQGPPLGTLACIPGSQMSLGCIWHIYSRHVA